MHLLKSIKSYTKCEPNVNYELYFKIMYQYWFNYNKSTTLMQDINRGKYMSVVGARGSMGTLFSVQLLCKSKTTLKKSIFKHKQLSRSFAIKGRREIRVIYGERKVTKRFYLR